MSNLMFNLLHMAAENRKDALTKGQVEHCMKQLGSLTTVPLVGLRGDLGGWGGERTVTPEPNT